MRVRVGYVILLLLLISSGHAEGQQASAGKLTLVFEGNKVFSEQELLRITAPCLENSRPRARSDSEALEYCLRKLKLSMGAKGYLQAVVGPSKEQETENWSRLVVPVNEGPRYRLGEVKIEGLTLFTSAQILEMLTLKTGDIADAEILMEWLNERVHKKYANFGYIQYTAEPESKFHLKDGAPEGVVDLVVIIDEGKEFRIRSIKFEGSGIGSEDDLRREMLLRVGEVFNRELFDESLKRISQTGQFEVIDVDRDVNYKWDQTNPLLDLTINLKKKAYSTRPTQQNGELRSGAITGRVLDANGSPIWN